MKKGNCGYCGRELDFPKDKMFVQTILKDGTKFFACYDCIVKIGQGDIDAKDFKEETQAK